ncbi:hypothetical protein ACFSW8_14135 [Rubritalea tangerina]|uniref:Uncharacterized protein n=1 Tax=Rubritalea tangerina TaxID=430798 RepID=A0ABW4ZDQ9_9BACT
MRFLTVFTLLIASILPIEANNKRKLNMPDWAFCVAYVLRDADQREQRPNPPSSDDPFSGDSETWIPNNILRRGHIVDVASLISRTTAQKILDKETTARFIGAISEQTKKNLVMDCYDPHHIFVFYDHYGKPVSAIEICLTCGRVKMLPSQSVRHDNLYGTDLELIAEILDSIKLSLHPFESLKSFKQQNKEIQMHRK